MKRLLEITEIPTLPKSALSANNERCRSYILLAQIDDLNEDSFNILFPYLIYFSRNKPSNSVTVGLGQAGLSFQMIHLVLNGYKYLFQIFPIL